METTFTSHVARRKLNFQQLENALGTPLPAVIKSYATLRDAKLAESSYDKVVMWTGGSYDNDDVVRALVRLDRPEMRPGTSGQSGKTVPTYFTDPEVDAPTIVPGSARTERRRSPAMERSPSRAFSTLLTVDRKQLKRTRYHRYYFRLDQLSDTRYQAVREDLIVAQKSQGFFGTRRSASGRDRA